MFLCLVVHERNWKKPIRWLLYYKCGTVTNDVKGLSGPLCSDKSTHVQVQLRCYGKGSQVELRLRLCHGKASCVIISLLDVTVFQDVFTCASTAACSWDEGRANRHLRWHSHRSTDKIEVGCTANILRLGAPLEVHACKRGADGSDAV